MKNIFSLTAIFTIAILLIATSPSFLEPAEAMKSKGTYHSAVNSKMICGIQLCSEINGGRSAYDESFQNYLHPVELDIPTRFSDISTSLEVKSVDDGVFFVGNSPDCSALGKGADLRHCDLVGIRIYHTYLDSADLRGANLNQAIITGINLGDANLSHSTFRAASMWYSNLGGADLSHADFSMVKLPNSNLGAADLSYTDFTHAYLYHANLNNTNSSYTNFYYSDLTDANFTDANIKDANFERANLTGADFKRATNQPIGNIPCIGTPFNADFTCTG